METIQISEEMKEKHGIRPFDITEYLDSEEVIQAYLAEVLKEGDQDEFIRALGYIAKARSINELAKQTGLGRESLYKTLSGNTKPRFDTILKILNALNIELVPQFKTV